MDNGLKAIIGTTFIVTSLGIGFLKALDKNESVPLPEKRESFEGHGNIPVREETISGEWEERIAKFKEVYNEARQNWDYFDKQFAPLDYISFFENEKSWVNAQVHSSENGDQMLRINFNKTIPRIAPNILVHETAHIWYNRLQEKEEFDGKWKKIATDRYHNNPFLASEDPKYCKQYETNVAAVSCYGATKKEENVAEYSKMVYELKTNPTLIIVREEAPRIKQLITLAAEYEFFSERERDLALERIMQGVPKEGGMFVFVK